MLYIYPENSVTRSHKEIKHYIFGQNICGNIYRGKGGLLKLYVVAIKYIIV